MQRILLIGFVAILALILYACNLGGANETPAAAGDFSALGLTVQAQNANEVFNQAGQNINYIYTVTNLGTNGLAAPVTVTDDKMPVTCSPVDSVGNFNDVLDSGESVTCASTYTIQQTDLNAGLVTNNAFATAGGVNSNTVATTVQMAENKVLTLTASANQTSYNQSGQTITFSYSVTNSGTETLGPAQFIIRDDRMGVFNCGGDATILTPNALLTCTADYITAEADVVVEQLAFNSSASGAGAGSIQPANVILNNTASVGGTSPSIASGTTIQHKVVEGEWMLQIARCYGADFTAVRNANLQVIDPNKIWPVDVLTVPNVGSVSRVYGPPCITFHTVVAGDTWNSIAERYNADLEVLMEANKTLSLSAGVKLKIPLNSAGGTQPTPPVEAVRLNIPGGVGTATVTGTVEVSKGKFRYVLSATQGQTLTIKLTAPVNEVALTVLQTNGTVLKAQDTTLTWSGIVPASADYYIDIVSIFGTANKVFTLEVGLANPTSAFERVADINTGAGDSSPSYLEVFGGLLYFNAAGSTTAAELWQYDSVAKTARRVADVHPGANSSNPTFLAEYNGALYFSMDGNDGSGVELWRFNGNAIGRLTDINPGAGHANPAFMTVYNGFLYFSANGNDGAGVELWRTDGTAVTRITDIHSGAGDANPSYMAVYQNALYFSAISNDGAGNELWRYDGTNIERVADINPGVGNANPAHLAVFNEILYFSANANDGVGTELWKFDGTTASRAADINPGAGDSFPTSLTAFNGALYFSANGNDGNGYEIWRFDGVTASRVSSINPSGDSNPAFLTVYNNELYFQANGNDGTGKELWKYHGQ